jgi:hypothetical protein
MELGDHFGRIDQSEYHGSITFKFDGPEKPAQVISAGGRVTMFGESTEYLVLGFRKIHNSPIKNTMMLIQDEASSGKPIFTVSARDITAVKKGEDNWSEEKRRGIFESEQASFHKKQEDLKMIKQEKKRARDSKEESTIQTKRAHMEDSATTSEIHQKVNQMTEMLKQMMEKISQLEKSIGDYHRQMHEITADYHDLMKRCVVKALEK